MHRFSLAALAVTAMTVPVMAVPVLPQTDPLLKYDFQNTTISTARAENLGTLGTSANATLTSSSGWLDQKENRDLSSLRPGPPNRAWRQTGGTLSGTGPRVLPGNADIDALDELESFTIAGWVWTNGGQVGGANGAFFYDDSNTNAGIQLRGSGAESLRLKVDSHTYGVATGPYTSSTSQSSTTDGWFFFAVTWDGSDPNQPASYYIGRPDETTGGVSLVLQDTLSDAVTDLGTTDTNTGKPSIFNEDGGARAMEGWLDDFAFWGEKTGGAGALTLDELEGYRRDTMGFVIPEPATSALLAAGLALAASRRRRA